VCVCNNCAIHIFVILLPVALQLNICLGQLQEQKSSSFMKKTSLIVCIYLLVIC